MAVNYSKEVTEQLIKRYQASPSKTTVEELAKEFNRTTKSIIGKLSREGVYVREVYRSKTGENPVTKLELVEDIAELLGTTGEDLDGLEKSPKLTLKKLKDYIEPLN